MGTIKREYKNFLDDIEKNIKDKEDLEYIKERFASFMDIMLNQIDDIMEYRKDDVEKLEKSQKELEEKVKKMQDILDNIEKDIYAEDGFDFEIVCPYCNYEFIIDIDENKTEVECPECKNTIELDWSGDIDEEPSGCEGHCSGCNGCDSEPEDEDDDM